MKKMYLLTVFLIFVITVLFLLFSTDTDRTNRSFLAGFGLEAEKDAYSAEEIVIPEEFDSVYQNYNSLQIEAGLDLSPYKGKTAVKYTYRLLNFPENQNSVIYANVICVRRRPVAGDIVNPSMDGFVLPLNWVMWNR